MLEFLGNFSAVLAAGKRSLSVFIHKCPTADFGLNCGALGSSSIGLKYVITMDTYTADRREWLRFFDEAYGVISPANHYNVGFEYNQNLSPADDGRRNLAYMLSKGVAALTIWAGLPKNDAYWGLLHEFLTNTTNNS
mmetsp:Transcript_67881/g.159736  ORF Transcript_67881/g.159736 Transcript_67881/m.159736 type:complete len:137 (-) Transcript_67881:30-440(-)